MTGDLGVMKDGWMSIVGRTKNMVVRRGSNIYPPEVERVLLADDRLCDVALVGSPDSRRGEIAAAFIEMADGTDREGLRAKLERRCRDQLALYKVPERWYVVKEIPRNQMRKPIKSDLLAAERDALA